MYLIPRLTLHRVMLTFALCSRKPESVELTLRRSFQSPPSHGSPISLLSAPLENMTPSSSVCPNGIYEIIRDIQRCTSIFLASWSHIGDAPVISSGQAARYDAQLQAIYSRILSLPSSENDLMTDWTYESCRVAALIYCRSIIQGATFADSANIMPARLSTSSSGGATLLSSLHEALGRTDTQSCWGRNLCGVFLWVTLIGSAASCDTSRSQPGSQDEERARSSAWMRKCFTLYAVRAAVSVPFEHADTTIHALRTMLDIRRWIEVKMELQATSQ
jgi:hypothetical protein